MHQINSDRHYQGKEFTVWAWTNYRHQIDEQIQLPKLTFNVK